jgi:hypothetical protein
MPSIILLISLVAATDLAKSIPTEADLRFCREEVNLVPWRIQELSIPADFPENFKLAMHDLWFFLFTTVKVRDAVINRVSPNLYLFIEYSTDEGLIASAETLRRDRCARPEQGRISYSKKHLNRTKEEFTADFFHELIHLMGGLSSVHQPYYYIFGRKNDQQTLGLINGYIQQKGDTFYAVSPGVLEEVHKVNPKLIGAAMECRKENGVRYPDAHWHNEKFYKKFGCDLMLPHAGHEAGLSKITVALINDFGWYQIDYEKLSHLLEPTFEALEAKKKRKKKWRMIF